MTLNAPLRVVVVSHTHWDREWYRAAVRFRQRLVALVDELLDHPPPPGASFLLDGQTIVLADYIAVRPERRDALAALLHAGRLEAGPWLVLADELIPGGEALVRNLLAGRRDLDALGAPRPRVLWCPDSFGHPASLPTIARGFGLETVVLWRGYGGARWPVGDTVTWEAPDGSRVLVHHLAPDGYELGSSLPADAASAGERWQRLRAVMAPRAVVGTALLPNGADHHARQDALDDALAALADAARPDVVERGSLEGFAEALRRAVGSRHLPVVRGELRDSYGYTWTLQGTFAARAAQKRRNAIVERLLTREAEPWAALARARGAAGRGPLLRAAWRTLLECHPHDSLCGCSIDDVAQAVDQRLRDARTQALGVRDDALLDVIGHDAVAARTARDRWQPTMVIRNPAARARRGVAEVTFTTFAADVPVGPGSASSARDHRAAAAAAEAEASRILTPRSGDEWLAVEPLGSRRAIELTESPRHYPDADLVVVTKALAWVDRISGYGTRTFSFGDTDGRAVSRPDVDPVETKGNDVANRLLRLRFAANGGLSVTDLARPVTVRNVLALEDQDDLGDLYTVSPRGRPRRLRFEGWRDVHSGALRVERIGRWVARDGTPVDVAVSLDAGASFVRFRVRGDHRGRDRRLRLRIATGVANATVLADATFGVVHREQLVVPRSETAAETPPPTAPLHRYVSLYGAGGGATVVSDGLAEYEATPDGLVAVTLLRAVGELSRNDLPERPGHAGWPAPTPLAQSRGRFAARFALAFHGPRSPETSSFVESLADDVLLPLRGTTLRSALEQYPDTMGVELDGEGIGFSTFKPSEDGAWLVARCVNLTDVPRRATWRFGFDVSEARTASLDETPSVPATIRDGAVQVIVGARSVSTLLVR
ncbi:MAG TPA: glycoside hydrolase family 38 C-terminal domain-containing protein [Gemmatimonadaceae bacterium]|nr:glycoside hydrolase family 38 C-terminal domain-containing protein [Gemmatimonadaceae bacterium]